MKTLIAFLAFACIASFAAPESAHAMGCNPSRIYHHNEYDYSVIYQRVRHFKNPKFIAAQHGETVKQGVAVDAEGNAETCTNVAQTLRMSGLSHHGNQDAGGFLFTEHPYLGSTVAYDVCQDYSPQQGGTVEIESTSCQSGDKILHVEGDDE